MQGYLLSFNNPEIIRDLDRLENYDSQRSPQKNLYNRQQIEVYNWEDRSLGSVWVYLMTKEQVNRFSGVCLPSGCWTSTK